MSTIEQIQALRNEASRIGVFFPMIAETEILGEPDTLHARPIASRRVLSMQSGSDADADGAPTAETLARYVEAVRKQQYGIVWLEPCAIGAEARRYEHSLRTGRKDRRLSECIRKQDQAYSSDRRERRVASHHSGRGNGSIERNRGDLSGRDGQNCRRMVPYAGDQCGPLSFRTGNKYSKDVSLAAGYRCQITDTDNNIIQRRQR